MIVIDVKYLIFKKRMNCMEPKVTVKSAKQRVEVPKSQVSSSEDSKIQEKAYLYSQKGLQYNDLCWILAEKQLTILGRGKKPSKVDISKKSEEIFAAGRTYDELCWFIAKAEVTNRC